MMKKLFLILLIVLFASCGHAGQVGVGGLNAHDHGRTNRTVLSYTLDVEITSGSTYTIVWGNEIIDTANAHTGVSANVVVTSNKFKFVDINCNTLLHFYPSINVHVDLEVLKNNITIAPRCITGYMLLGFAGNTPSPNLNLNCYSIPISLNDILTVTIWNDSTDRAVIYGNMYQCSFEFLY